MSRFFEFRVSKTSRDHYRLDELLLEAKTGEIASDFHVVRLFVKRMNELRETWIHPERVVRAADLNAIKLIDEVSHYILDLYRKEVNPQVSASAMKWLNKKVGTESIEKASRHLFERFPPVEVYRKRKSVEAFLREETGGRPNTVIAWEEMFLLALANGNQAFSPFSELFSDQDLRKKTPYLKITESLDNFFETQPLFGPQNESLSRMLRAPANASPGSLSGQLVYIKDHWGSLLSGEIMKKILLALDLIKEEEKLRFLGPGPALVPYYGPGVGLYDEPERFSMDRDWMPRVVLIAKSVHVWLDQLSRKYGRSITHLDQIPDEELDILARWGFTALWLIGVWERSPASQEIKRLTGNPEALASAYAIYDYTIASDLGGEDALQNLKERARQRGILLASDMVPNHTGIDSMWVIEHPDWFLQLGYSPFPSYQFTGPNLSAHNRFGIYIEDGYWNRTDAAVVFKRVDQFTGETRYIYHGNDGTSMPWNDTAQLNFLRKDVREAVINTILHVTRKFPIIRFDAAMTLTKRHFQRLWHPQPGTGGDIPSRAEHGMSREEFDRLFPVEFWREVVDRVAEESPDTLLLAEAFWLMEGYFVRTLGMHRVYNSAFMNMLKMEENAKYRGVMKNVLEFNPEILKRFVNFMSNPDEATAVAQFGKEDKYIGIALMMVTMPGLPMFGHGQIEGFTEKYGMEYRRAYADEEVDWGLVQRHEAEIFPFMRKRHLFSGVENFTLYDFHDLAGGVDENVFAYSNRFGEERSLIIYNNKYQTTRGWVKVSTPMAVANGAGAKGLAQKNLAEGLGIKTESPYYYVFRDHRSGLEFIRQGKAFSDQGLYVELGAYQYHAFHEFREIQDDREGHHARLESFLSGRGVPDMEVALTEMLLAPIHDPFKEIMNPLMLERLVNVRRDGFDAPQSEESMNLFKESMKKFLDQIKTSAGASGDSSKIVQEASTLLSGIVQLGSVDTSPEWKKYPKVRSAIANLSTVNPTEKSPRSTFWRVALAWLTVCNLGKVRSDRGYEQQSAAWMDEWLLGSVICQTFQSLGCDAESARREAELVKILVSHRQVLGSPQQRERIEPDLRGLFFEHGVQQFLEFNWYDGILWFSKERFEALMEWLLLVSIFDLMTTLATLDQRLADAIRERYRVFRRVCRRAERSGFRVERMLANLTKPRAA